MPITVCIVDDTSDIRLALEEIIRLSDDYKLDKCDYTKAHKGDLPPVQVDLQ